MRILHICYSNVPQATAMNGGELRYWQNFTSLVALGHEVHLLLFTNQANTNRLDPEIVSSAASVRYIYPREGVSSRDAWMLLVSDRSAFNYYFSETRGKQAEVSAVIETVRPDLVWTDWIGSIALVPQGIPILASHTDFYHKILQVRDKIKGRRLRWIDKLRRNRFEAAERHLITHALGVECVSDSERQQIEQWVHVPVRYIPIVGKTISPPTLKREKGRVILFGNLNNTALRYSMQHFRNDLLPLLDPATRDQLEWHQVGAHNNEDSTATWIKEFFTPHGFVADLSEQFQIGDACFSPYSEDTGFRTKFVTAAGYGLVNIGYRETFLCAPEFTPGKDCLAAESAQHMIEILREYASDMAYRQRLGEAARELYEEKFSFEAQLPKFQSLIQEAMRNKA